jgi:hypothetical protein
VGSVAGGDRFEVLFVSEGAGVADFYEAGREWAEDMREVPWGGNAPGVGR